MKLGKSLLKAIGRGEHTALMLLNGTLSDFKMHPSSGRREIEVLNDLTDDELRLAFEENAAALTQKVARLKSVQARYTAMATRIEGSVCAKHDDLPKQAQIAKGLRKKAKKLEKKILKAQKEADDCLGLTPEAWRQNEIMSSRRFQALLDYI